MIGDVEPVGHLRLGARRRGRRARRRRTPRPLAAASCVEGRSRAARARSARRTSSTSTDDVYLSQRDVRELQFAKASIATGWTILCRDLGIAPEDDRAGAARRLVRLVPVAGERGPHRARAEAAADAHRRRPGTSPARARRSRRSRSPSVPPRRAVLDEVDYVELSGPHRLQRPVHRPARVPGMTTGRSSPAERSRSTSRRSRGGAAGTSTSVRCRRSCTTGPSGSRRGRSGGGRRRRRRRRVRRLRHARRARRAAGASRRRTATSFYAARPTATSRAPTS